MEKKQYSREPLKDALKRMKEINLTTNIGEGVIEMIETFLKLPDLPPRPPGVPPKYLTEMSFYEWARLPVSEENPIPSYEYLLEQIKSSLGQMEWAEFIVRNNLNR